jgi:alkylation response protein AidB-like acyl-CoA dehydrogenase
MGTTLVSPLSATLGFAETIDHIASTAAERERNHRLPHEEIAMLKELGFGALRLPADAGGRGISLSELFTVALDLTSKNKTVGLSFTETDAVAAGARPSKVLSRLEWDEARRAYIGSGVKVYATGNLYNDAFVGLAVESREGRTVQYVLDRGQGVSNDDDWQGFGQRLTGSGTAKFDAVTVPAAHVYPTDPPRTDEAAPWGYSFHQVYLTNCIAGIVRRVALDAVEVLRARGRNFYHGDGAHPTDEPVLQTLLGRIRAYAASVEDSYGTADEYDTTLAATLAAAEAKVVIDDLAPQIASWLIDLGSGSVVSRVGALDRHWRNIKVIASHNPRLYKERLLGQNLLTGQLPPTGAFF